MKRSMWLFVGLVSVLGCGGGGEDPTGRFTGAWNFIQTSNAVCSDGSADSASSTGQLLITRGTDSDLVRASAGDAPCPVKLNIGSDGLRATLVSGPSCSTTAADGTPLSIAITTWNLTVDSEGKSGSEAAAFTIGQAGAGSCSVTSTSTLSR
jgi:hypothetical protein